MEHTEFSSFLSLDSPTFYDSDHLKLINKEGSDPTLVHNRVSPVGHNHDDLNVDLPFTDLESDIYNLLEIPVANRSELAESLLNGLGQSAASNLPIKQETADVDDYRPPSYLGYESSSPGYVLPAASVMASGSSSKASSVASPLPSRRSKALDKNSEDYRRRRERNNIAVRKSREKAKHRSQATEQLVQTLQKENETLQKRVSELNHEVQALHSCFESMLPDHLKKQIAQSLQTIRNRHKHLL